MSAGLTQIRLVQFPLGPPLADRTARFEQQLLQTIPNGCQQKALLQLNSGFPLFSPGRHGPQHAHERSMCVLAVGKDVIKRNADGLAIHLKGHGFRGDSRHRGCRC